MATWPAAAVYAVVITAAVVENFFPPAPADVVITLAAFLSHRGTTDARTVFLITWVTNVGGALLVYWFARQYGRGFVTSRVGRRLLSPESVVAVERGYLRFGLLGLFAARLLPGFRSFTAPFSGLIHLSLPRTVLPIALASGLWYGALTTIGARLGASWDTVSRIVTGLNQTLGILALLAAAGLVFWLVRQRRRRGRAHRRERLEASLASYPSIEARVLEDPAAAAVAALLLEMSRRDRALSEQELGALEAHLRGRWHLAGDEREQGAEATETMARSLIERMAPAARVGLARRLWELAFSDGVFRRHEAHVMERAAQLLGLGPEELAEARRRTAS